MFYHTVVMTAVNGNRVFPFARFACENEYVHWFYIRVQDASVVFTSSSVGRQARAFWGAYAIAKSGLESMSKIFSDELANVSSIRFNCINPGPTRTNMRTQAYPGENPFNLPTPDAIMPLYLYLMSADSKGITGQSLDVPRPD